MTVYVDWLNCFYFLSPVDLFEVLNFQDKFFIASVLSSRVCLIVWKHSTLLSLQEFIGTIGNNSNKQQTDSFLSFFPQQAVCLFFPKVNWADIDKDYQNGFWI